MLARNTQANDVQYRDCKQKSWEKINIANYIILKYKTQLLEEPYVWSRSRPIPFYDFALFVVLSLFMAGSLITVRKFSASVGRTTREKTEDNKTHEIMKWNRPDLEYSNIKGSLRSCLLGRSTFLSSGFLKLNASKFYPDHNKSWCKPKKTFCWSLSFVQ